MGGYKRRVRDISVSGCLYGSAHVVDYKHRRAYMWTDDVRTRSML
jgi:hypothetical protein